MLRMRGVLVILLLIALNNAQEDLEFPPDFKFGVATSSYQIEGGWNADGKGPNIWDWITQEDPEFIVDGSDGNDACKAYEKAIEDVDLIENLGVDHYQFSISWSRLFPTGHVHKMSDSGHEYYENLINALVEKDIQPIVTMFHWDLPLPMHELGGWPNPKLADYFESYASKLFELFGDRVKYWITFNEPFQFCNKGYSTGMLAPAYAQDGIGGYLCSHTVLLAHAKAFQVYNDEYRDDQGGQVGIALDSMWFEPEDPDVPEDVTAAEDSLEMMLDWFAHPIFSSTGDYPVEMKSKIQALSVEEGYARSRLPEFTSEEIDLIKGSADFFGLSHYASAICRKAVDTDEISSVSYDNDVGSYCYQPDTWEGATSSWPKDYPAGLSKLLNRIRSSYNNKPVFITKNGVSDTEESNDCRRVNYLNSYLREVLAAIEAGSNVVAYTAWSLMDSFEWKSGYTEKFGLLHVNFDDDDRSRTPKMSAKVYMNIIQNRKIDFDYTPEDHTCRSDYIFPDDFRFGVATASYQVEGAHDVDGKGESIWDRLTNARPELIDDGENGNIACDAYHKTTEDVQLLKNLGVHFYRFSISWSRILPTGQVNNINEEGIAYYNDLIEQLLENDIEPMVTMYHWDLPQALQEIGGWPNIALADIFADYANLLFDRFGDRVQEWITFNEPYEICALGYSYGRMAPVYTQDGVGGYLCGHTVLLAHAKAYRLYKEEYSHLTGKVGITVHGRWSYPGSDTQDDRDIADTNMQMHFGWFLHPIFSDTGDYPPVMKTNIARISAEIDFPIARLPTFTTEEITMLKDSSDFLGFNHYTSTICSATGTAEFPTLSHAADTGAYCEQNPEWDQATSSWLKVVPEGFKNMLVWIKDEYNNPPVIVTENGYSEGGLAIDDLQDCDRVEYYNSYLEALLEAIHVEECNVIAYTAWSFMDNFEWMRGYTEKFGLYHVDFTDPARTRRPKMSADVFKDIIENKRINRNFVPDGFTECPSEFRK